jgi:FkbM family methyltransferase
MNTKLANKRNPHNLGRHLWADVSRLLAPNPVVFDVGANLGTTVKRLLEVRPSSLVHSFEPNPAIYSQLVAITAQYSNVTTHNLALGSETGQALFQIQKAHMSSSFLTHRAAQPESTQTVSLSTVDVMCQQKNISHLHLLKSDTQGFELHVLKGASTMLDAAKIDLVMLELMFEPIYLNYDRAEDIIRYLDDRRYRLVGFYNTFFGHKHHVVWCDALFVRESLPRSS